MDSFVTQGGGDFNQEQYLAIEDTEILKDCSSSSQVLIGNFTSSNDDRKEAAFLRSNDIIEIYDLSSNRFTFITKYQSMNGKCLEMQSLRLTWKSKDILVVLLPKDMVILLEFDEETNELRVLAMYNFENQPELKDSGKRFPFKGKLRTISTYYMTLFGYISDDQTFVQVELRQAVMPLEINKTQSITTNNIVDYQQPRKFRERYLNAWGQNAEAYFKPAAFHNLRLMQKIQAIVDIELVEMNQSQVYLYVLYQSDFDKTIGTVSRQPITKLSIFELVPVNNESTDLSFVMTVECLSYYARNIVRAFPEDDYTYVIAGPGFYVIRPDNKRFSYVQTSSMAGYLDHINSSGHHNPEKNIQPTNEQMIVKNIIDCKSTELRFDGATRVMALPGRRMIILTEKGLIYMMHLKFDQAEIDVADAIFTPIKCDQASIPSSIAFYQTSKDSTNFKIIVSSYYNNQSYQDFSQTSKQSQDLQSLQIDTNQRPRLDPLQQSTFYATQSTSSISSKPQELVYEMTLLDSLTTISPITDVIPMAAYGGDEHDYIVISGYGTRSQVTFVKEYVPFDSGVISQGDGIKRVFTIRDKKQPNSIDVFIFVSYEDTTTVLVPLRPGSFQEVDSTTSGFELKETTIAALTVGVTSPQKILQVTPTKLILTAIDGKPITKVEFQQASQEDNDKSIESPRIIGIGKEYLECSDLVFIMLSNNTIKCYSASSLKQRMIASCYQITQDVGQVGITGQITAFSTCTMPDENEYLIVTYQQKDVMRIYQVDELNDQLIKVYEVKHVTYQMPFLPNQLEGRYLDLLNRSTTDLSVELAEMFHTTEIHKELVYVTEVHLRQLDKKQVLILCLSNHKVVVYENINLYSGAKRKRFRFKIVEAQVLRKFIKSEPIQDHAIGSSILPQLIFIDQPNQLMILDPDNPFILSEHHGRLLFHKLKAHNNMMSSLAQFRQGKQPAAQSLYLYVNQQENTLNILKMPLIFDPKLSSQSVDTYAIKQVTLENKSLKKAIIFNSNNPQQQPARYLVMSLFSHNKGEASLGIQGEHEDQRAQGYQYEMWATQLPVGNNWKLYTSIFDQNSIIRQPLKTDEIIVCMEEVRLKLMNGQEKNFIAISSLKLDSVLLEECFYNSFLHIYDIEYSQDNKQRFKLACLENFKGTITCLTHFQGHIVAVNKAQRLKDLAIVYYKFNDLATKFIAQIQPQSIETLGLSISFDNDFIFVGDGYKNIRVLWLCDKEELKKKELIQDAEGVFNLKRLYSNTFDTSVLGVYSLRAAAAVKNDHGRLTASERQALTILTASEDGYIRIHALREKKLLECISQINIQERILKILPLPLNPNKPVSQQKRRFLVIPLRGGMHIVTTTSEQEHLGLQSLMMQFSHHLPHRGGLTPIFAHKIPQVDTVYEMKKVLLQRMNQEAIDKKTLKCFYFMFNDLQKKLAEQIGYSERTLTNYFAYSKQ